MLLFTYISPLLERSFTIRTLLDLLLERIMTAKVEVDWKTACVQPLPLPFGRNREIDPSPGDFFPEGRGRLYIG